MKLYQCWEQGTGDEGVAKKQYMGKGDTKRSKKRRIIAEQNSEAGRA